MKKKLPAKKQQMVGGNEHWTPVWDGNQIEVRPPSFYGNSIKKISHRTREVKDAIRLLFGFFYERGKWGKFTISELTKYCKRKGEDDAGPALFGLICSWFEPIEQGDHYVSGVNYIVQVSKDEFVITTAFIRLLTPTKYTSMVTVRSIPDSSAQ